MQNTRHITATLLLLAAAAAPVGIKAQNVDLLTVNSQSKRSVNLDLSVTAGTTGIGFELSMPIGQYVGVRAGGTFMPKFEVPMTFTAQIGTGDQMTADGKETRFQRMARILEGFVGQPVDDKIDMAASPTMHQGKVLVDIKPFRNKNWHFTTGLYIGKSKVAQCINKPHETTPLLAVNLYNHLHDNNGVIITYEGVSISVPGEFLPILHDFGRAGFPMGYYTHDIVVKEPEYYEEDQFEYNDYTDEYELIYNKGDLKEEGVYIKKGDPYIMTPSADNTATANAFVNKVRPYVGVGYSSTLGSTRRWAWGFDAGVMFWGGAPKLIDHSGVDLMHDVSDIRGDVGRYVNLARHAKAYPILEFKLTHRLW